MATAMMMDSAIAPPEPPVPGVASNASAGEINIPISQSQSVGIYCEHGRVASRCSGSAPRDRLTGTAEDPDTFMAYLLAKISAAWA